MTRNRENALGHKNKRPSLVALAFTFDLSIPDLFRKITQPAIKTSEFIADQSAKLKKPQTETGTSRADIEKQHVVLPNGDTRPEGFSAIDEEKAKIRRSGREIKKPSHESARVFQGGPPATDVSQIYQAADDAIEWQLSKIDDILNSTSRAVVRKCRAVLRGSNGPTWRCLDASGAGRPVTGPFSS